MTSIQNKNSTFQDFHVHLCAIKQVSPTAIGQKSQHLFVDVPTKLTGWTETRRRLKSIASTGSAPVPQVLQIFHGVMRLPSVGKQFGQKS